MQIDFHHAVTYVVARWSGFDHADAATIAYAAQYVDDSTKDHPVVFADGSQYARLATAHKMLDPENFEAFADHISWVPFHFLPGAEGDGTEKLLCVQNSVVAQTLLARCIADCHAEGQRADNALHRLGITAHTYVDTWAHQKFAGILDAVNELSDLCDHQGDVPDAWDAIKDKLAAGLIPHVGHGQALTYPDAPWLKWSYVNGRGDKVQRDNLDLFVDAAHHLAMFFQRFRLMDSNADVPGLDQIQQNELRQMFDTLRDDDGGDRHAQWIKTLATTGFKGIEAVQLDYWPDGPQSWKGAAFGNFDVDIDIALDEKPPRTAAFDSSDWKKFQDAAHAHLNLVTAEILPAHGCTA